MPAAPPKSRTDAFAERLDAQLRTFKSDDARRFFLSAQFTTWQTRYGQFIAMTAMGRPMPCEAGRSPADAFDYLQTITLIARKMGELDAKPISDFEATLDAVREAVA